MKSLNLLLVVLLVCLACQSVHGFEIAFPGEAGFLIGLPMSYIMLDARTGETEHGLFIFGQSMVVIEGKEYYDSVFKTETKISHFYFGFNFDQEQKYLTLKGLATGMTELLIEPAASVVRYPLSAGNKWQEGTTIVGKNVEIPNLGILPSLTVQDVLARTTVSAFDVTVPAGEFSTLCVETNFAGNVLNIPLALIHRTWLNPHNITVRKTIEFLFMGKTIPLLDMQLQELYPSVCKPMDKLTGYWGRIKTIE